MIELIIGFVIGGLFGFWLGYRVCIAVFKLGMKESIQNTLKDDYEH